MAGTVLSSKWDGLNKSLLASIYAVDFDGKPLAGQPSVASPLTDANIELSGNWQSAFEQSGPEAKAPTLMAMLQTGSLSSYIQAFFGKAGSTEIDGTVLGGIQAGVSRLQQSLSDAAESAIGRSGMTKLNSTQVFTGAAPVKITGTLHFRAYDDPGKEVQRPVDQLSRWVLPRELAKSGALVTLIEAVKDAVNGRGGSLVDALLPSKAPQLLGMRYGGYTFSPMVLETVGRPLTVPMTQQGEALHITVTFTLSSLTALDAADWDLARRGQPIAVRAPRAS